MADHECHWKAEYVAHTSTLSQGMECCSPGVPQISTSWCVHQYMQHRFVSLLQDRSPTILRAYTQSFCISYSLLSSGQPEVKTKVFEARHIENADMKRRGGGSDHGLTVSMVLELHCPVLSFQTLGPPET